MKTKFVLYTIVLLSLFSCNNSKKKINIIFIGHCYRWHEGHDKIDKRIESINYKKYDELWLGGDVCSEVTENKNTLKYIDSIFHISNPKTYWTLGNHDTRKGHLDWITKYTKRKTFYATNSYGITKLILNTCFNSRQVKVLKNKCKELDEQFKMIKNVTDTIKQSSYLIILVHGAVWTGLEPNMYNKANLNFGNYKFKCDTISTFKNAIYPMFVKVRKRGVKVVCISGDYGQKDKAFEYKTKDDIVFLGSGINNSILTKPASLKYYPYVKNTTADSILTLKYNIKEKKLTWKFHNLNEFVANKDNVK